MISILRWVVEFISSFSSSFLYAWSISITATFATRVPLKRDSPGRWPLGFFSRYSAIILVQYWSSLWTLYSWATTWLTTRPSYLTSCVIKATCDSKRHFSACFSRTPCFILALHVTLSIWLQVISQFAVTELLTRHKVPFRLILLLIVKGNSFSLPLATSAIISRWSFIAHFTGSGSRWTKLLATIL